MVCKILLVLTGVNASHKRVNNAITVRFCDFIQVWTLLKCLRVERVLLSYGRVNIAPNMFTIIFCFHDFKSVRQYGHIHTVHKWIRSVEFNIALWAALSPVNNYVVRKWSYYAVWTHLDSPIVEIQPPHWTKCKWLYEIILRKTIMWISHWYNVITSYRTINVNALKVNWV